MPDFTNADTKFLTQGRRSVLKVGWARRRKADLWSAKREGVCVEGVRPLAFEKFSKLSVLRSDIRALSASCEAVLELRYNSCD